MRTNFDPIPFRPRMTAEAIEATRQRPRPAPFQRTQIVTSDRWTPKRKATLVQQILDGTVTAEEACSLHAISPEELQSWMDDLERRSDIRSLRVSVSYEMRGRRRHQRRRGL